MADGEGALVAQQRFADEIPYQNIDTAQKSIQMGLSAWQTANAIKLKRQEIEGKMFALQQRNQQLEWQSELREKQFGLAQQKAEWDKDKAYTMMGIAGERLQQQRELGEQRIGLMADNAEIRHQKDLDRGNAQAGLFALDSQLAEEGFTPGTREWANEYQKRGEKFAQNLSPSEYTSIRRSLNDNVTAKALQQRRIDEIDMRMFKEKVGAELFGNPGMQNLTPILNPEGQPDAVTYNKTWMHPITGVPQTTGEGPNRLKQLYSTDLNTGITKPVGTASVKKLTDLSKEYQELLQRQSHTALPVTPQVKPLPADKKYMEQGALYDVPGRGTMKWTGTGLVPPS